MSYYNIILIITIIINKTEEETVASLDNCDMLKYASYLLFTLCSNVIKTKTIKLANKTVIDCKHSQVHKHFSKLMP